MFLSSRPPGDCVFRPSSQGVDQLVVSWKVADNLYQHVEIKEFKKDNEYTLGKDLVVDRRHFSDLDEISALYIEPLTVRVRQITTFPKFSPSEKDDICELICMRNLVILAAL